MNNIGSRRLNRALTSCVIIFILCCVLGFSHKVLRLLQTNPSTIRPNKQMDFTHSNSSSNVTCSQIRIQVDRTALHKLNVESDTDNSKALEEHTYRSDGLVEVNPDGEHPIYELVKRAQEQWDRKLKHASETFDEAVAEYQRRYGRLPPPGFDAWWSYVEKYQIQLPDEYDQIFKDLEPFWGVDPKDLQVIQREWEAHADTFTVGKDTMEEPITLKNFSNPQNDGGPKGLAKGAYQIAELLKEVEGSIPSFRAVFSPHDSPNLSTDFELKEQALKAAEEGIYINVNNPPQVKLDGWISGCSPDSPAKMQKINQGGDPVLVQAMQSRTFIHNHRAAMDPCQHPSLLSTHGQFISHGKGPVPHRKLVPQFSFSPTMVHYDIMPAMPINWIKDILPRTNDPEWDERWDERLHWRGRNTGMWHAAEKRWDMSQRTRLVIWAGDGESMRTEPELGGNLTVLMPSQKGKRVGHAVPIKKALWTPAMADVAFAGEPIHCPPDMCDRLAKVFEFRKYLGQKDVKKYRYYIDVDGNAWSSRFKRLITSNALVFKSTIYPEWYLDRVAPWVHYVPIQVDLSDLWDAFTFFRGDPLGQGAQDDMAKKIAQEGRKWSKTYWRQEDLVAYMFRLFLEYARVMDPERKSMDLHPSKIIPQGSRKGLFQRLGKQVNDAKASDDE